MALGPEGPVGMLMTYQDSVPPESPWLRKNGKLKPTGWWRTPEEKLILPETTGRTHLEPTKLSELLRSMFVRPGLDNLTWDV